MVPARLALADDADPEDIAFLTDLLGRLVVTYQSLELPTPPSEGCFLPERHPGAPAAP